MAKAIRTPGIRGQSGTRKRDGEAPATQCAPWPRKPGMKVAKPHIASNRHPATELIEAARRAREERA